MKQSNTSTHGKHQRTTAMYTRLSRDDDQSGESNSIQNQKIMLSEYAEKNGYTNCKFFVDDGISGATFERKGFQEMLAMIEAGEVERVIVKDLSRLGRNFLEVGQYTEYVFPQHNIHFIAIMDNVDSNLQSGTGDFITPIKNIFNEMYISDVSRKLRNSYKSKSSQGYPVGKPPFGYIRDPANPKRWIVDKEAAEVVRRIYQMRLEGNSIEDIAKALRQDKVDLPSVYAIKKGLPCPNKRLDREEYRWNSNMIDLVLKNQSYCGDVVNFKTFRKAYMNYGNTIAKARRLMRYPPLRCLYRL